MAAMQAVRVGVVADATAIQAVTVSAGERFRTVDDPRIARCADDEPWTIEELSSYCAAGRVWVAQDEARVVGAAIVDVVDGCAHVDELSVDSAAQGRGFGVALLDAVQTWAAASGLPAVTLTTFRDVPWNRPYYERRGFVVLHAGEITPGLATRVAEEAAHGLLPELRVVMRREVSSAVAR
jgi:GNAT superfamily N-acetyltransferase